MPANRLMSEFEGALFTTVAILGHAIIKLGANGTEIVAELRNDQAKA